eukprot:557484-Rhodomonas_salina.1
MVTHRLSPILAFYSPCLASLTTPLRRCLRPHCMAVTQSALRHLAFSNPHCQCTHQCRAQGAPCSLCLPLMHHLLDTGPHSNPPGLLRPRSPGPDNVLVGTSNTAGLGRGRGGRIADCKRLQAGAQPAWRVAGEGRLAR